MTVNLQTESPEARKHRLEHQKEINRRYYLAHKNNPAWIAKRKASNKRNLQQARSVWDKNAKQRFKEWLVYKNRDQITEVVWQVLSTRSKKELIKSIKKL